MERVIANAKNVSASTARLLTAAAVRANPNAHTQIRLRAAGKTVGAVTEQAVATAKSYAVAHAGQDDEAALYGKLGKSNIGSKVAEMEAQMSILKMEMELEVARGKLATVRKTRYTGSPASSHSGPAPSPPPRKLKD
jgi:hypothetical protein